jgi:phosphonoacetate hydrolase
MRHRPLGPAVTRTVACLDGLDPAYLDAAPTPAWDRIAAAGATGTCEGLVPTLTNVNNVGIATGRPPAETGIAGNSRHDGAGGETYTEADGSRVETHLARAAADGADAVVLVAKAKLEGLVGAGASYVASAESPPAALERAVGAAPDIYSGAASAWLLDAAAHLAATRAPDLLYVSTTDVVAHSHAPDEPAAREWVRALDDGLDALAGHGPLVAVADHGMNEKRRRVDLRGLVGPDATVVRPIRDRHTYHHRNLGGAAYVHAAPDGDDGGLDRDRLRAVDGVERVLGPAAAADRFALPPDRVGEALVLGDRETVFGPVADGTADAVELRSHGSVHERTVPYLSSTGATLAESRRAFDAL